MCLKDNLTPEKLVDLLYKQKLNMRQIGSQFGVSRQRIHQVYSAYKKNYPELFTAHQTMVPSKKQIQNALAKTSSMAKAAQNLRLTTSQLRTLMKRYKLKKAFLKDRLEPQVLVHLYIDQELSDQEIASRFNCSPNTIAKLRYQYGIYQDQRPTLEEKLPKKLFEELYLGRGLLLSQIAELFGVSVQKIINLKKVYQIKKTRARGVSAAELHKLKVLYTKDGDDHEAQS